VVEDLDITEDLIISVVDVVLEKTDEKKRILKFARQNAA
jgi:hypothetical protein